MLTKLFPYIIVSIPILNTIMSVTVLLYKFLC